MNRQQQQRVTRQQCRYCGKTVSSDQYVTHQTQCLISLRQRRQQQQQQHPPQQQRFTQQRQQQRQPQRQTYQQNIYYDDSDGSVESDQNEIVTQMPDFNQIFGPGSVFQRSMQNMRNQMTQAFNINLNFDNNQLQFNIQSNGGGRQQVFVSNMGPGIHISQTFNYPSYEYYEEDEDEEDQQYEEEDQQAQPMNTHQIKQIPTQKYKPNPSNQQCVVCMIDFKKLDNVKVLDCLHTFHAKCIEQWLKQKGECPVCRHRLI